MLSSVLIRSRIHAILIAFSNELVCLRAVTLLVPAMNFITTRRWDLDVPFERYGDHNILGRETIVDVTGVYHLDPVIKHLANHLGRVSNKTESGDGDHFYPCNNLCLDFLTQARVTSLGKRQVASRHDHSVLPRSNTYSVNILYPFNHNQQIIYRRFIGHGYEIPVLALPKLIVPDLHSLALPSSIDGNLGFTWKICRSFGQMRLSSFHNDEGGSTKPNLIRARVDDG
ncbi:hypothetical protein VNO77_39426 [Canavalia gladiata]|uniref:Uncharacterized protein n=1 Tax=Canavalia gladiata TaxID=3824 RepID=A0AAN9KCJ9_CANGL